MREECCQRVLAIRITAAATTRSLAWVRARASRLRRCRPTVPTDGADRRRLAGPVVSLTRLPPVTEGEWCVCLCVRRVTCVGANARTGTPSAVCTRAYYCVGVCVGVGCVCVCSFGEGKNKLQENRANLHLQIVFEGMALTFHRLAVREGFVYFCFVFTIVFLSLLIIFS